MFEVGEEGHIELDATLVDVDTDALVGGMDELARFAGVDKAAEAMDAIADTVELARVSAGILHVGGKARLGVDAGHRRVPQLPVAARTHAGGEAGADAGMARTAPVDASARRFLPALGGRRSSEIAHGVRAPLKWKHIATLSLLC